MTVYGLDGPPSNTSDPMSVPSVQTYSLDNSSAPSAPVAAPNASFMDTSYGANSLQVVNSVGQKSMPPAPMSSSPVIAEAPVSAASLIEQAKQNMAGVPVSSPAPVPVIGMQPIMDDGTSMEAVAPQQQVSAPPMQPIMDEAAAAPVQPPVDPVVSAPVVAPAVPPVAMMSTPTVPSYRTPESCEINKNLVDKISLLETEKESLRKQTMGLGALNSVAQCASETARIQNLEAQISYLKEENESLKRLNNEHFANQAAMATQSSPSLYVAPTSSAPMDMPTVEKEASSDADAGM